MSEPPSGRGTTPGTTGPTPFGAATTTFGSGLTGFGTLPAPLSGAPSASSRPSVIQLVFREKGALYAAYIPLLSEGGLFVPTTRDYKLGEDIYLLLSLPEDPQRYPVAGKVAWITPVNASGGRTQGVGVSFPADEKTRVLRLRIEEMLGTTVSSAKPTQTI
ncbi:N/A [soil metagenome]